jgi:hypothetical protein
MGKREMSKRMEKHGSSDEVRKTMHECKKMRLRSALVKNEVHLGQMEGSLKKV